MNGAESLIRTAVAAGVEVCFANPGTTEMPLVVALDTVPGIRAVLGLFEGVCTGAADGYGRMTGKPALTLLHLGPGFANGIANLHNARRARSPIVNLIGDHATWHVGFDAPLTSDIVSLAKPVSGWVHRTRHRSRDGQRWGRRHCGGAPLPRTGRDPDRTLRLPAGRVRGPAAPSSPETSPLGVGERSGRLRESAAERETRGAAARRACAAGTRTAGRRRPSRPARGASFCATPSRPGWSAAQACLRWRSSPIFRNRLSRSCPDSPS